MPAHQQYTERCPTMRHMSASFCMPCMGSNSPAQRHGHNGRLDVVLDLVVLHPAAVLKQEPWPWSCVSCTGPMHYGGQCSALTKALKEASHLGIDARQCKTLKHLYWSNGHTYAPWMLHDMTSTHHLSPSMMALYDPLPSAPRTFTGCTMALRATPCTAPAAMPATCVPWPWSST